MVETPSPVTGTAAFDGPHPIVCILSVSVTVYRFIILPCVFLSAPVSRTLTHVLLMQHRTKARQARLPLTIFLRGSYPRASHRYTGRGKDSIIG